MLLPTVMAISRYIQGSGRMAESLLTWNAGNCCAYAQIQGVDDVGFISALLDNLEKRANIESATYLYRRTF